MIFKVSTTDGEGGLAVVGIVADPVRTLVSTVLFNNDLFGDIQTLIVVVGFNVVLLVVLFWAQLFKANDIVS